jgi:hypothetical protein
VDELLLLVGVVAGVAAVVGVDVAVLGLALAVEVVDVVLVVAVVDVEMRFCETGTECAVADEGLTGAGMTAVVGGAVVNVLTCAILNVVEAV